MPTFKRSKADDHPYITGRIPGLGFSTWQVSQHGVTILKRHGISDGDQVPIWLLKDLLNIGAATTGRSGVGENLSINVPTESPEEKLHLAFSQSDSGWQILVLFPELPSELVQQMLSSKDSPQIGKCGIRIDGTSRMPATDLWPGKGGKAWPVAPHEGKYAFELVGPWPTDSWSRVLENGLPGLSPKATLFEANEISGQQVLPNSPLLPGQAYVVVSPSTRHVASAIPRSISRESLGVRSTWEAWRISLPTSIDESTRNWLINIGFGVQEPVWRLELASPVPKRIQVNNIGIYTTGSELLFAAVPDSPTLLEEDVEVQVYRNGTAESSAALSSRSRSKKRSSGWNCDSLTPRYFTLDVQRVGTYEIRASKGRVRPLLFLVELPTSEIDITELDKTPEPLQLLIAGKNMRAFLNAESEAITFGEIASHPAPAIECVASVTVAWAFNHQRESHLVQPAEAARMLAEVITRAASRRSRLDLRVDGGNFGAIELVVEPARISGDLTIMPSEVLRIADWLAASLVSARWRHIPHVRVPDEVRSCFRFFNDCRACAFLANLTSVPRPMIAQINALSRRLRNLANCSWRPTKYDEQVLAHI